MWLFNEIYLCWYIYHYYIKNKLSTGFCEGSTQIKPFIYHSYYYVQDIQLSSLQVPLLQKEEISILLTISNSLTFESLINIWYTGKKWCNILDTHGSQIFNFLIQFFSYLLTMISTWRPFFRLCRKMYR